MATRNPTWNRDELILALDFYLDHRESLPGKQSQPIRDLSNLLHRLDGVSGSHADTFRNANGVYMKLMNFRRFDPLYTGEGKVGLTRGGKGEEEVWRVFANDNAKLKQAATAIRAAIDTEEWSTEEEDYGVEAEEGRILTRVHRRRERNRAIVERRKSKALRDHGKLVCEACGFDFADAYGERGRGFIECHHTKPVHTLSPRSRTRLEDLALLCANCHRMIHASQPWLSVQKLQELILNVRA